MGESYEVLLLLLNFHCMKYYIQDSSNPLASPYFQTNSLDRARKFARQWNSENVTDDLDNPCHECFLCVTY